MLDKRLKILLAIVIVLLLGRGLYVLVMKKGNIIEEPQEQPEEVVVSEPMDVEITDLKGPKQKYTNKTLGFSFEFPDELEYQDYGKSDYTDYYTFSLINNECLKSEDCETLGIYNKWLSYYVNFNYLNDDETCDYRHIDKEIKDLFIIMDELSFTKIKSLEMINNKDFLIKEVLYEQNYESIGTSMVSYICSKDNLFINIGGITDIYEKESEKFNPLYLEFKEVVNSLESLSN